MPASPAGFFFLREGSRVLAFLRTLKNLEMSMKKMNLLFVGLFAALSLSYTAEAATPFDPFIFHVSGSCQKPQTLWFHQSAPWFRADLGREPNGLLKYANIDLQLFPNHTYWLRYNEVVITRFLPNGGTEGFQVFATTKQGKWAMTGAAKLEIPGLLSATPMTINDHGGTAPGMAVRFAKALNDPRLLNFRYAFGAVYSKFGPRGASVAQYCHKPAP